MMRPIHLAEPQLDGRKTECEGCYKKTPFGKESCELHRSDWIPNSQEPRWNKKITVVLDAGCASVVIAIYNNGSRGRAHELIGWCVRQCVRVASLCVHECAIFSPHLGDCSRKSQSESFCAAGRTGALCRATFASTKYRLSANTRFCGRTARCSKSK